MKLNNQEKKDLDKYTKFLVLKSVQVIVQSRLGAKISTPCKPDSQGSDWFNLNITDQSDILAATKQVFNGEQLACIPLCVEISLQTQEKDQMVLETWCLSLLPEQCEPSPRIIHNIYNRMGILLKSLMSVTRVTPAYKLSRRQGPESYIILYKVFMDHPLYHNLGEGHKEVRIGQICMPVGTLQLSLAYRTKMTISPTQTGRPTTIMVKSDHFNSNSITRSYKDIEDLKDLTKPMRPGPFATPIPKKPVLPTPAGVTRLLALAKIDSQNSISESETENDNIEENDNIKENGEEHIVKSTEEIVVKVTEENGVKSMEESPLQSSEERKEPPPTPPIMLTSKLAGVLKSYHEEYRMKKLSAPFSFGGSIDDLMEFYNQCRASPPLQSPLKGPSGEEVSRMIEMYEQQLPEYDALVQSFSDSSSENN